MKQLLSVVLLQIRHYPNPPPPANITATSRSCRFMLHSIRRTRPLLTQRAVQTLVRVLFEVLVLTLVVISCLDYCPSLLAGRPAAALRPLQLIQKPAAPLVFNLSSLTLLRSLHWLPVAASVKKHEYLVPCCGRIRSSLYPGHGQTSHPRPSTPLCIDQSAAPSLRGTAVTQQHHDCFLSWLLNGGTSSTWT